MTWNRDWFWSSMDKDTRLKWREQIKIVKKKERKEREAKGFVNHPKRVLTPAELSAKQSATTYHQFLARLRYMRLRGKGPPPTRFEIERMLCFQDYKCKYCKVYLDKYHINHKIPVVKGGSNKLSNLQALCPPCNMKKRTMTDKEYKAKLKLAKLQGK